MSGLLALCAFSVGTLWLFWRDVKERPSVSSAAWIVVAWAVIYGSRPVTSWFSGADQGPVLPSSYDEGNPGEALVNLSLILAGLIVLLRRGIRLPAVIRDNTWLSVCYLFWLFSVSWSDYPLITAKRLFKDLGNVIMVLVVLTGKDPGEAFKAVCARCAYVLIPLSIVLIRYYPDWGRTYVGYQRNEVMYVGVTTHKNTLGALALVTALVILWDLLELRGKWRRNKVTFASRAVVVLMSWYLLMIVDSATSLVVAVFGSVLLVALSLPFARRSPGRVEAYGVGAVVVLWIVDSAFKLKEAFVESLGRDMTLTTRTEVWAVLTQYQDNPLVGAGFSTFWAGRRLELLYERLGPMVQAHNGYLETYLNGGLVGVGLLVVLLLWAYWRIRKELVLGTPEGSIRLVVLLAGIIHNYAEASFYKLSLLWFVIVFAIMGIARRPGPRQLGSEGEQRWSAVGTRRA